MQGLETEETVTYHVWVSFAFLIADHPTYNVWVERGFAEQFAEAIRGIDKKANRPIFVSLCKDSRFHGILTGIHDVAMDSADILRSFGIMVTTDVGMWRLMYMAMPETTGGTTMIILTRWECSPPLRSFSSDNEYC